MRDSLSLHFLFEGDADQRGDAQILARVSDGLNGADIENISLAARRRTILGNQKPSLAEILLAIRASRAGSPRLLDNRALTTADKKALAALLHAKGEINQAEISRIVGVSRQMVHRYLKEMANG